MVQNLHSHQENFSRALVTGGHWRWRPGSAEDGLTAGEHVQSHAECSRSCVPPLRMRVHGQVKIHECVCLETAVKNK